MEDEEENQISRGFQYWEQIQIPLLQPFSSSRLQSTREFEAEINSSGCEMAVNRANFNDDCSIFPPRNHEGLQISPQDDQNQEKEEEEQRSSPERKSSISPSLSANLRLRIASECALRHLRLGFEIVRFKTFRIGSSIRSYAATGRAFWLFALASGVGMTLLLSFFYMLMRRWRRRIQEKQRNDFLKLLIQEKDKKIIELLNQIAQMNEILLSRYRVLLYRRG